MLVSIAGSQGCGKTTTINKLKEFGYGTIERKTSRSILSDWGVTLSQVNNDRELTVKFQNEILFRKLEDEAFAVNSKAAYITERTYADLFVYALVALGKDNEYSEWLNQYYEKCVQAQSMYSAVCYLTAGHFDPVHDGVRGVNKHYSKMVDLTMSHYTNVMTQPETLCVINTPSLDERVQIILTEIQLINDNKIGE